MGCVCVCVTQYLTSLLLRYIIARTSAARGNVTIATPRICLMSSVRPQTRRQLRVALGGNLWCKPGGTTFGKLTGFAE